MSDTMKRLEFAAWKAIFPNTPESFYEQDKAFQERLPIMVRAILTELREPSEGTIEAMVIAGYDGNIRDRMLKAWQAAIDSLLSERHPGGKEGG